MSTPSAAVAGLPRGLVRPAPADRAFLAQLADVGLPRARAEVSVQALPQIARSLPTPFVAEGLRVPRRVRNSMTAFTVRHPQVTFVVDPGICTNVVERAVSDLPGALRLVVKPPKGVLDLRESLARAGMSEADLDFALPTHLHWDHVSGLLDLPDLPVRLHTIERAWAMTGTVAPVGGVRSAVKGRPVEEYELDGPPVLTFPRSHDLLGDGSVTLVDLTGHTPAASDSCCTPPTGPSCSQGTRHGTPCRSNTSARRRPIRACSPTRTVRRPSGHCTGCTPCGARFEWCRPTTTTQRGVLAS